VSGFRGKAMAIEPCPQCQSLWDEYRDCVAKIHQLREMTEIALHSRDHEEAKRLFRITQPPFDTFAYIRALRAQRCTIPKATPHVSRPG